MLLSDDTTIKTRVVVWAGGLMAAPLAGSTGLPQGHGGRIDVQPDLTVTGFPAIYVLGDGVIRQTPRAAFSPSSGPWQSKPEFGRPGTSWLTSQASRARPFDTTTRASWR